MQEFIQQAANGIMSGSIYALIAAGLALVFGVLEVPQFALGAHAMLGAYITYEVASVIGLNYWVALVIAIAALVVFGALVQVAVFDPLRKAPPATLFIAAFGLLLILEGGAQLAFGPNDYELAPAIQGGTRIFGAAVTYQRIIVVVVAVVCFGALSAFLRKTAMGLRIRAFSDSSLGALVVGLKPRRLAVLAMAIGSGLAGLAGGLIAPISQIYPTMGDFLGLDAFVIIVLAGMGSIGGAILGGYVVGLIEAFGSGYLSVDYHDAYAFVVLVLVLAIKPEGLFRKTAS